MNAGNPIICAIDTAELARARALIAGVRDTVGGIKLGLEFFSANGPAGVRQAVDGEMPLFLDLKLHDIPNTAASAVRSAAALEPLLHDVLHAARRPGDDGRLARNAADLVASEGKRRVKLLGVTVLTSLDDGDLSAVGQQGPVGEQVRRLALLARDSGLDGVVCAPLEVAMLREVCGPDFLLVVPGIRPAGCGERRPEARHGAARGDPGRRRLPGDRAPDHRGGAPGGGRASHPERAPMSVQAKICGLSSVGALDAAIRGGARFVGFVFYPASRRHVTPERAAALAAICAGGRPAEVGLLVDPADALLAGVLERVPLDLLQLHGSENPRRVAEIKARFGKPIMKAIPIAAPEDPDAAIPYLDVADWLLFDAKPPRGDPKALPGGNGLAFDWQLLGGRSWSKPWMLSGGLTAKNVAEAVATTHARAVDVSSGVENRPGVKDLGKIVQFLAKAGTLP